MSGSYQEDRCWSDQFIPDIQRKVGPHLLVAAPFEIDAHQATDLIVLRARDMMVAARIRRPGYADRYLYEFTIRSRRESGVKTELAKLLAGFGDWLFYGHAARDTATVEYWMLIDLAVWRETLLRRGYAPSGWRGLAVGKSNGDGTHFFAFDVRRFPEHILIASHLNRPTPERRPESLALDF